MANTPDARPNEALRGRAGVTEQFQGEVHLKGPEHEPLEDGPGVVPSIALKRTAVIRMMSATAPKPYPRKDGVRQVKRNEEVE